MRGLIKCYSFIFPLKTSPNMLTEHQRPIFNMPLNVAPYFPHGSTSLTNYIALRESTRPQLSLNPSQDLPRRPALYLGTSSVEVQICEQPLDRLRHLAKEYKSSTGLEEPLNLSRKENSLETLSDTPSSFGPPPSKKPKFLNEASPLYPPRGLTTEEGAEQEEAEDETSSGEAGTVPAGSSPVMAEVIDLTSSSSANPVPRRASPPSVNLFNRRVNYSEAFSMKARERDQYTDWLKEESSGALTPKLGGILNQSSALGHPPLDTNGKMEIQIPLKLLHELIRRGLVSNQAITGNGPVSQGPTKAEAQPDHKLYMRSHSDISESSTTCEKLSTAVRNLSDTIPQDNSIKKHRLLGGNGISAESKLQMMSSFYVNNSHKHSLDKDIHKPSQPKQAQVPMTYNHESMNPRPRSYSEDTPLSLTMKPGRKSEKVMATSNIATKDILTSPALTSDHLKFLLANLPYRLERGQTF